MQLADNEGRRDASRNPDLLQLGAEGISGRMFGADAAWHTSLVSSEMQKVFCTSATSAFLPLSQLFHDTRFTSDPEKMNLPKSQPPINRETALRYQSEAQLLRAQFNGDFLCNTLVLLQSCLIGKEPKIDRLRTAIDGMSDYYRYALTAGGDGTVPLRDEWQAVEGFLTIQKLRFGDGLDLDCEISQEASEFPVPRIFLQPLVDNAVKYGRKTGELPTRVSIRASCPDKRTLQVEVSNTGSWYERDERSGHSPVSLENLRQRLAEFYPGKKHRMTIATSGGRVTVKIQLSRS